MFTTALTSRNHKITLTVDGTTIDGTWMTFAGGGLSGESKKFRPGGMADEESLPVPATREAVTISREYRTGRDSGLFGPGGTLETARKDGKTFVVTKQDLDHQRQAVGAPKTYTGHCDSVTEADRDSEGNEVHTVTLVISVVA